MNKPDKFQMKEAITEKGDLVVIEERPLTEVIPLLNTKAQVMKKECPGCGIEKPIGEYGKNKRTTDGYHYYCRTCNNRKRQESRKREAKVELNSEERKWKKYMEMLYEDSIKPGAPAATRDLYAVLVGKKVEKKEVRLELSADEIARRNLVAQREIMKELEEGKGAL